MIYACDNCHFLFSRTTEPEQCPDCGKYTVRRASRVIRPAPLTGPAIQCSFAPHDLNHQLVGQTDNGHGAVGNPALVDTDLIGAVGL